MNRQRNSATTPDREQETTAAKNAYVTKLFNGYFHSKMETTIFCGPYTGLLFKKGTLVGINLQNYTLVMLKSSFAL